MDEQEIKELLLNPYYAVTLSPSLFGEHEPMVSKEKWIEANCRLIDELGKEEWLRSILKVLETGGPKAEDIEDK